MAWGSSAQGHPPCRLRPGRWRRPETCRREAVRISDPDQHSLTLQNRWCIEINPHQLTMKTGDQVGSTMHQAYGAGNACRCRGPSRGLDRFRSLRTPGRLRRSGRACRGNQGQWRDQETEAREGTILQENRTRGAPAESCNARQVGARLTTTTAQSSRRCIYDAPTNRANDSTLEISAPYQGPLSCQDHQNPPWVFAWRP